MASKFQLTANILSVKFKPKDFIELYGMVWSKHRGGRPMAEGSRYNKKWSWDSSLPEPVAEVLLEVSAAATIDLVERKALPTFWPKGLMEEEQHYPFNLTIESLTIYNSEWDKDKLSEAQFRITSNSHKRLYRSSTMNNPDSAPYPLFSWVDFDEGWELNHKLFPILEEHM